MVIDFFYNNKLRLKVESFEIYKFVFNIFIFN